MWSMFLHRMADRTADKTAERRSSYDPALRAAESCMDGKANDVVVLDLAGVTDMTDYFVIASGTSDTHVRAVAERVRDSLEESGIHAHHIEGLAQGRWVLLDYIDFVVHVFHPALREFYQLERLWGDAEVVPMRALGAHP
jgi:ribosome-associated protein